MTNYKNGAAIEWRIKRQLESKGFIVIRSAGSHSEYDLIAIDKVSRTMFFIQAKPRSLSNKAKTRLQQEISWIDGNWVVKAKVISLASEMELK